MPRLLYLLHLCLQMIQLQSQTITLLSQMIQLQSQTIMLLSQMIELQLQSKSFRRCPCASPAPILRTGNGRLDPFVHN